MADITVYTMNNCPYCVKAKNLLGSKGIAFKEVNTDSYSDAQWEELCGKSGMKTLPQIFNGDAVVGGFTELDEADRQDGLAAFR